jgi:6-phosphogluconolactonase
VTAVYLDRPANRLTVTPLVFNTSRNIVFMVTGENKAPKLAAVLNSPNDPLNLPAQRIRAPEGRLTWFVDGYAAKYLVNEGQRD